MSDMHQQGSAVATIPSSGVAWAADVFAPFNMAWKEAPAKKGAVRVLGSSADQQALLDVTIRGSKVIAASAAVPVRPEYTPMLTFLLAVLVESATRQEADAWLARGLNRLRRDRPSETIAPWHQWRVVLATTSLGLLTMQIGQVGFRYDSMVVHDRDDDPKPDVNPLADRLLVRVR